MIKKMKESLVVKVSLLFMVAAAIPYLLATIFFFNSAKQALYGEIVKGLEQQTLLIRDNIDARLMLLRGNTIAWADLSVMGDIVTDDIDKRIANVLEGLKEDYHLPGEIHALNTDGQIVASSSRKALGETLTAPWMEKVLAGNVTEVDVHPSARVGGKTIAFAAPVKAPFGERSLIGVLLMEYRADRLIDPSLAGGTFHVAIADSKGMPLAALHEYDPFSKEETGLASTTHKTVTSPSGHIVAFAPSLGSPPTFKGFGWTIAGAVSEEEALGPVRKIARTSIAIALAGMVTILILVTLFSRRSVRPLRELSETANRIAETKDFSSSVHSGSADEVGQLAEAFNGMVAEINTHIQRMQEMEEEIRRADRLSAVGELSAGMAHEIKNPLGIIRSSADILKGRLDKSGQEGLLASAIAEESERLSELLEAFLQFARPRPPLLALCNLNEVVEKSIILLESEMSKSGIELLKRLDGNIPSIMSDANQLHQVLVNLIINATQAMPEGGKLTLSTKTSSLSIPNSGDTMEAVELTVGDTGTGIDPEIKAKVFNPFYTTKDKGTGLGLSIVYRIINGLGGEVKVEEGEDGGTLFKIILPLTSKED